MSGRELRLAVVGTGGIYLRMHSRNLQAIGGNKVIAVCDVDEANLKQAMEIHGARGYNDFGEMLDKERDIDGLLLCTPPTVRREVIELAAERKIPVFCEKPPARSLDDARAIIEIVEKSGVPVSVGFMYRYLPSVAYLKSLIRDEKINLVQSTFLCSPALTRKIPGWFFIKEKSGGHIVDQAIHVIDLLRFIVGDIETVHTLGNNVICEKAEDFTIEDSSSTNLRFASGASGNHTHSWAYRKFVAEITVTGAEYRLTLALDFKVNGWIRDDNIEKTFDKPPGASHHYYEMKVFLDALRTGDFSGVLSPYRDAAKTLATVIAMNKSIESGKPERVEL